VCLLLGLPAVCLADGLPVMGVEGGRGVLSPDGESRYLSVTAGKHTVLQRVQVPGGEMAHYRVLAGSWSIPMVAYDGSGSGISADGRTLVLIRNRTSFPQRRTHLAIANSKRLTLSKRITLPGDFSFDAVSPDGSSIYLINYLSGRDPTKYAVRAFDVGSNKLLPDPIVDPNEPGEDMGGMPVTRAASTDGRWAYTLYDSTEHPFIHALDTTGRTARCIDLDALVGRRDIFSLRLKVHPGDGNLSVVNERGRALLSVNAQTFEVSAPRPAGAQRAGTPTDPTDGGGRPWLAPALIAAALLAAIGGVGAVLRRQGLLARGAGAR
jgi:hypothetical protein